jgi:hypothetical protein
MTKLGKVFRPEDFDVVRLVQRGTGSSAAEINVEFVSDNAVCAALSAEFN